MNTCLPCPRIKQNKGKEPLIFAHWGNRRDGSVRVGVAAASVGRITLVQVYDGRCVEQRQRHLIIERIQRFRYPGDMFL